MKEAADRFTLPLEGVEKPRRGRPPKPDALTPAQRARAYRERLKADPVKRWEQMIAKTEKLRDEAWPLVLERHQAEQAAKKAQGQGGTKVFSEEDWPFPKAGIGC